MKKQALIITGVGLVVGVAEALLYYNLGKNNGEKISFKLPPSKELATTAGVVLLTSLITAGITQGVEMAIDKWSKTETELPILVTA